MADGVPNPTAIHHLVLTDEELALELAVEALRDIDWGKTLAPALRASPMVRAESGMLVQHRSLGKLDAALGRKTTVAALAS